MVSGLSQIQIHTALETVIPAESDRSIDVRDEREQN